MRIPTHFKLIPIFLAAGSLLTAQSIAVDKSTLSFSAQFQGAVASQQLTITSTAAGEQYSIFSSTTGAPQWLKVNGQTSATGTPPSTVTVTADPAGLVSGTYTGTLTIFGTMSPTQRLVNVKFTVSTLGANPSSVTFSPYTVGSSN